MGILSDFVVAGEDEAEEVGESDLPSERWPTLEGWKGVEIVKLSSLYCAVTGVPFSPEKLASFELVGGDEEEGPWVYALPQDMVEALAGLDASSIPAFATQWAETEELAADGWQTPEAEAFIQQISGQAKLAVTEGKRLYLWLSL